MSSTSVSRIERQRSASGFHVRALALIWWCLLAVAFVVVFWAFFYRMFLIATNEFSGINADWGHIVAIPLIALFFLFIQRDRISRTPVEINWLGFVVLLLGIFGFMMGLFPVRNDMAQGLAMVTALFGLVWFVFGSSMLRYLWFPVLYMLFMIKISDRIWNRLAVFLQELAADLSTVVLQIIASFSNFDVANRGATIDLSYLDQGVWVTESLNVAEACAGLRMLMAFIAMGVAIAFIWCRHHWQRAILISLTIPIAVAVNVGRVTILGLLYLYDRELAQGAFHTMVGMLMLIPGLLMFVGIAWILEHLIIEDEQTIENRQSLLESQPVIQRDWRWAEDWRRMGLGALWGALLTVMIGLIWTFGTASWRPDFLGIFESGMIYGVIAVILIVATFGLSIAARRMSINFRNVSVSRQRAFIFGIVFSVLIVSAVGQSSVIAATKYVLIRKPVPLVHPLFEVPSQVGDWKMIREHDRLSKEMQDELGTDKYFTRDYVDTTLSEDDPGRLAQLHVAYYTGTTDTVPHVPERCMLAGGAELQGIRVVDLELDIPGSVNDPDSEYLFVPAQLSRQVRIMDDSFSGTLFTYSYPQLGTTDSDEQHNIIYFFVANGNLLATPDLVRLQGFDFRDEYGFYCKIEVRWPSIDNPEDAAERTEAFLSAILPEILACLPDWVDVKAGRWPIDSETATKP